MAHHDPGSRRCWYPKEVSLQDTPLHDVPQVHQRVALRTKEPLVEQLAVKRGGLLAQAAGMMFGARSWEAVGIVAAAGEEWAEVVEVDNFLAVLGKVVVAVVGSIEHALFGLEVGIEEEAHIAAGLA